MAWVLKTTDIIKTKTFGNISRKMGIIMHSNSIPIVLHFPLLEAVIMHALLFSKCFSCCSQNQIISLSLSKVF